VERLIRAALAEGFSQFKMKVGLGRTSDLRRAGLIRRLLDEEEARRSTAGTTGDGLALMMDANSVWEVGEAIEEMRALRHLRPWWIEEPISPDDAMGQGRVAEALAADGIAVASGEQCVNKVMMKQFIAAGLGICQADAVKMGGLNEWLVCAMLAERAGVPVCPHAGGVGLCNMAAHLSCIDFACIAADRAGRTTEHIDHLQEHLVHPVQLLRGGWYAAPTVLGWGLEMKPASLQQYEFPHGTYWSATAERRAHFDAAGTPW